MISRKDPKISESAKVSNAVGLEVSELLEISEKIFRKIDRKLAELKSAEDSAQKTIIRLDALLKKAEKHPALKTASKERVYDEIRMLWRRGLKNDEIAEVLDVPKAEVQMVVSLARRKA